jgi:hypothetical protein
MALAMRLVARIFACIARGGRPRDAGASAAAEAGTEDSRQAMFFEAGVDFSRTLRRWDGFGVNYVQAAQTYDYQADPQDYGGFSILSEPQREEILDLIFGDDGLRPGIVKMFIDPLQQDEPSGPVDPQSPIDLSRYDHRTSTESMRRFVKGGLERTRRRGDDLQIIATLYGPPGWMTRQRVHRGRDLDPARREDLARYMVAFVKYMREVEGLPVRYLSVHNEGESWRRWNDEGLTDEAGHDYNLYWPREQIVDYVKLVADVLEREGLSDVGMTPGETSTWTMFSSWGIASAVEDDPEALEKLALITSHGFYSPRAFWLGDWRSAGADRLREKKPALHAWTTSSSWGDMDPWFLWELHHQIYGAKVNGIIPWACIHRHSLWKGSDPNRGCAFAVSDDGNYSVEPGYHVYKHVCRAGQPGMAVADVYSNNFDVVLFGFASGATQHPDAFVAVNVSGLEREFTIRVTGTSATRFRAVRSVGQTLHEPVGELELHGGRLVYVLPGSSITTFTVV